MPYPIGNMARNTMVAFSKSQNFVIWRYDVINDVKMTIFGYFSLVIANFTHLGPFKGINSM